MSTNGYAKWTFAEPSKIPVKLVKIADEETLFRHWEWIETRLKVIRKKDKSNEEWTPAHIREAIIKGFRGQTAVEIWFGVNTDGVIEGFIVTTVIGDPFIQLPVTLLVWLIWANERLIAGALPQLEEIARRRYLKAVEFVSSRQGWFKKAPRLGFDVSIVRFRKELK